MSHDPADEHTRFTGDAFTGEYLITADHPVPTGARPRLPTPAPVPARVPWALLLLGFVDTASQMIPVLRVPERAAALGDPGTAVGALAATFALAQVASAVACGRLSDRRGRRDVLIAGLLLSAVAQLLFVVADGVLALVAARALHGVGSGTAGVALAALADGATPRSHSRLFGWFGAATSLGAVLGPALCATLASPELAAAALLLATAVVVGRALPRSTADRATRAAAPPRVDPGAGAPQSAAAARQLVAVYAVAIGSASGVATMLPLLLADAAGAGMAASALMFLGATGALLRALVVAPLSTRFGDRRMLVVGLTATGAALAMLALPAHAVAAGAALLALALGTALTFPTLSALLTRTVPEARRGAMLGIQQAVGGLTRAVFPAALGVASDAGVIAAPLLLAAGLLAAFAVALAVRAARRARSTRLARGAVRRPPVDRRPAVRARRRAAARVRSA